MNTPNLRPEILNKIIQQCGNSDWNVPDDSKREIADEVLRYCVAAGVTIDLDKPGDEDLLATLCACFQQGLLVGWQYAQLMD